VAAAAKQVAITANATAWWTPTIGAPAYRGGDNVPHMHAFGVKEAVERLRAAGGGYEVVHESAGIELGVYVLVAPEPDRQQPHEDDEVYVVLEGRGVLQVEGESVDVEEGSAVFVEAGAEHRFTAYEQLAVLVIFERKPV
jgi:mannose-6-phosphate isomerase-like protein (cupin superfamily)